MKAFTTTDVCKPLDHYMVDISERIEKIKKMVDDGKYFTMNRPRRYGKTTTLHALCEALKDKYIVVSFDFQEMDYDSFDNSGAFSKTFARLLLDAVPGRCDCLQGGQPSSAAAFDVRLCKKAKRCACRRQPHL